MKRGSFSPLGFTLVEVLTVLAILGILMAVGLPNLAEDMRKQRLASGVQDVATVINDVRTRARSQNTCARLSFGAQKTFLLERFATPDCSGTAITTDTIAYDNSMLLSRVNANTASSTSASTTSVTLISPYGTNSAGIPLDLTFASAANANTTRQMRISGVLGTVIMQ